MGAAPLGKAVSYVMLTCSKFHETRRLVISRILPMSKRRTGPSFLLLFSLLHLHMTLPSLLTTEHNQGETYTLDFVCVGSGASSFLHVRKLTSSCYRLSNNTRFVLVPRFGHLHTSIVLYSQCYHLIYLHIIYLLT